MRLKALSPIYCHGKSISHICLSLCEHMQDESLSVEMWVPTSEPSIRPPFLRRAVPPVFRRVVYRTDVFTRWLDRRLARGYLASLEAGDVAYIWPGVPVHVYREAKRRGAIVVSERINCHQATAKAILDDAYARLGWPVAHGITDEAVAGEREKLELADYIFVPSPPVAQSLLDNGVPESKLLRTSYGWDPDRLKPDPELAGRGGEFVALFVGLVCVRKGVPLLLDIWERAGVSGTLLIVGDIFDDVAARCADQLKRANVSIRSYQDNVAGMFRQADVFVFPTLEEGSPLVTYEAMACGLPILTSPLGAGEIVRDGKEGFVMDAYDTDAWVATVQRVAADRALRAELGRSCRERAAQYTWRDVGVRRRALLLDAMRARG